MMNHLPQRSGSIAVSLLLACTLLLTISGAALWAASRSFGQAALYRSSLPTLYGAESGANWGLGYLKNGGTKDRTVTFTEGEVHVKSAVIFRDAEGTEERQGVVRASSWDGEGKNYRFLSLLFTLETKDGTPAVTVEEVSTDDDAFPSSG